MIVAGGIVVAVRETLVVAECRVVVVVALRVVDKIVVALVFVVDVVDVVAIVAVDFEIGAFDCIGLAIVPYRPIWAWRKFDLGRFGLEIRTDPLMQPRW